MRIGKTAGLGVLRSLGPFGNSSWEWTGVQTGLRWRAILLYLPYLENTQHLLIQHNIAQHTTRLLGLNPPQEGKNMEWKSYSSVSEGNLGVI